MIADQRRINEQIPTALGAVGSAAGEVLDSTMRIHEVCIERPAIVEWLGKIAPDKQQIALVHAIEVGITELIARRERFQR